MWRGKYRSKKGENNFTVNTVIPCSFYETNLRTIQSMSMSKYNVKVQFNSTEFSTVQVLVHPVLHTSCSVAGRRVLFKFVPGGRPILLVQPWLDFRAQHLEIMVLVDLDTRFNENEGAFLSTGCNTGPHHNTQITQTLPLWKHFPFFFSLLPNDTVTQSEKVQITLSNTTSPSI